MGATWPEARRDDDPADMRRLVPGPRHQRGKRRKSSGAGSFSGARIRSTTNATDCYRPQSEAGAFSNRCFGSHAGSPPHETLGYLRDGLALLGERTLAQRRPEKAHQLPRDRDDGDLGPFPIGEMLVKLVQAVLRLPRLGDHRRRLPPLTVGERGADARRMAIRPGGLDEHMPAVAVAGLGDRPAPLRLVARVFGG